MLVRGVAQRPGTQLRTSRSLNSAVVTIPRQRQAREPAGGRAGHVRIRLQAARVAQQAITLVAPLAPSLKHQEQLKLAQPTQVGQVSLKGRLPTECYLLDLQSLSRYLECSRWNLDTLHFFTDVSV